jgi:hypothetical protein
VAAFRFWGQFSIRLNDSCLARLVGCSMVLELHRSYKLSHEGKSPDETSREDSTPKPCL